MVEFNLGRPQQADTWGDELTIEEPIAPISQLGETIPEHDATGRFKNVIQIAQAAIRGGAGTMQLMFQTAHTSPMGGRPKAYGKEIRETLKEVQMATGANIIGAEMPTSSFNNASGFDYQQFIFSEDKRKEQLDELKDAMKFMADVSKGGAIDNVSWEFPRAVNDADWQKKDPNFHKEGEQRIGFLVDERTGRTTQFRKDEIQHIPYHGADKGFKPLDPADLEKAKKEGLGLTQFKWDDFVTWAEHNKQQNAQKKLKEIDPEYQYETPEQLYIKVQLEGQIKTMKGWRTHYLDRADQVRQARDQAKERMNLPNISEDDKKLARRETEKFDLEYKDYLNSAFGQDQQATDLEQRYKHYKTINKYAMDKSTRTYAEAGIFAMQETQRLLAKEKTGVKPIHIGPEIGWPDYYGSHPEEFMNVIRSSRDRMVDLLTTQKFKEFDPAEGKEKEKPNPHYNPGMSQAEARKLAQEHIKGTFDTGHMAMWLSHFKPLTNEQGQIIETEEQKLQRFNKWFNKQVETLAKAPDNLVGGIQLVDSASAAHGHLPPGEGIFPVIDAAKIFQKAGYKGWMVSEGHEEEKFGEGRIRTKLWQHAGAKFGTGGYFQGAPLSWRSVQSGYFARTYSPMQMFGGYSPSNEFKLWSEVPLE
ncbi:hypothetical protein COV18_07625 [Candidatus Woesearchaeota archaeon CG10_big_fil_rev_8_21_14_0_10_37_12]|nr:MAG: hypothetical protein COV18_07625 [Candidatus Woesearchaeota archaeon CG10_big_fil_rev_8_21_14_0_10_37_12]